MAYHECDFCAFFVSDEETGEEYCSVNFDEDDFARFLSNPADSCPYYRSDDEYEIVKHQN